MFSKKRYKIMALSQIRAAAAAAGIPIPVRAYTREDLEEAIGKALASRFGNLEEPMVTFDKEAAKLPGATRL